MELDELRAYALSLPYAEESMPFGEDILAFTLCGKIFMLLWLTDGRGRFNVKCDPERAIWLRDKYAGIEPGFHMNKRHWNTVYCNKDLTRKLLEEQILHSYICVKQKLPKRIQQRL